MKYLLSILLLCSTQENEWKCPITDRTIDLSKLICLQKLDPGQTLTAIHNDNINVAFVDTANPNHKVAKNTDWTDDEFAKLSSYFLTTAQTNQEGTQIALTIPKHDVDFLNNQPIIIIKLTKQNLPWKEIFIHEYIHALDKEVTHDGMIELNIKKWEDYHNHALTKINDANPFITQEARKNVNWANIEIQSHKLNLLLQHLKAEIFAYTTTASNTTELGLSPKHAANNLKTIKLYPNFLNPELDKAQELVDSLANDQWTQLRIGPRIKNLENLILSGEFLKARIKMFLISPEGLQIAHPIKLTPELSPPKQTTTLQLTNINYPQTLHNLIQPHLLQLKQHQTQITNWVHTLQKQKNQLSPPEFLVHKSLPKKSNPPELKLQLKLRWIISVIIALTLLTIIVHTRFRWKTQSKITLGKYQCNLRQCQPNNLTIDLWIKNGQMFILQDQFTHWS